MITMGVKIGSTLITGITFSITESRVDEVDILISNLNSLASQRVTLLMENENDQQVITSTATENFATAQTISIIFQSDVTTDVSPDLSTFLGLKKVGVELLP